MKQQILVLSAFIHDLIHYYFYMNMLIFIANRFIPIQVSMHDKIIKINNSLFNKAEIARALGISRPYVSLILSGKRKSEKYNRLIRELLKNEFS